MLGLCENDFESPNEDQLDKVIRVLKVLKSGQSLIMGDREYKLAPTKNDSHDLIYKVEVSTQTDEYETRWFGEEGSLTQFIKLCENVDDYDLIVALANNVLNKK